MNKNISVWLIIPQTNLHVGNESVVSFGVIDKTIQRDVTTTLPCIHSSSLKGAIKEFLTDLMERGKDKVDYDKDKTINEEKIKNIFGSIKKDKNDIKRGSAIFFDANLLYIPEQCTDNGHLYQLAYCEKYLKAFADKAHLLGVNCTKNDILEKIKAEVKTENISGSKDEQEFEALCNDEALPIIARNCLDNGESINLWYEQVLPSLSVLGTIIETNNADDLDILDKKIVQIGANATIGYGYCKFVKL